MDDDDPEALAQRKREEAAFLAAQEAKKKEEAARLAAKREEEERQERQRKLEEMKAKAEEALRKKKEEEMYRKMGSDVIQALPDIPPSVLDDRLPKGLRAWFLNEEASHPVYRMCSLKPGRKKGCPPVTLQQLRALGVVYFKINLSDFSIINRIVQHRCYKHTDEVRLHQTNKDEYQLEKWFAEHMNDDEQVRLITDGSCYLDVRSRDDEWIRLQCTVGDTIVLPAGLYHRGTLDESDYCSIMRLFQESGRWCPVYRSEKKAESLPCRKEYLQSLRRGNISTENGWK